MNITFNNKGLSYHFGDDSCGGGKHLSIRYKEVVSIRLDGSREGKEHKSILDTLLDIVFKPSYSIVITYYPTWHEKSRIDNKVISVTSSEIRQARAVIDFVNNYIAEQNKKSQIDDAKLEYAKKNDTIEIVDLDGNIEKVWKRETFFGDIVLVADGGTTYHTHADCYESWKDSYKANFKCWKKISITDAKSQGYKLCRICERYYDFADSDE